MHEGHRERMRAQLRQSGMDSLSDVQVLEVLLYHAFARQDTNLLAHALIARFGSLAGVFEAPVSELVKVPGIGPGAAELIALVPQIERRHLISRARTESILTSTAQCGQYLDAVLFTARWRSRSICCASTRSARRWTVFWCRAAMSTLRAFLCARSSGPRWIPTQHPSYLAHNHPSGVALPSEEDKRVTQVIRDALDAVDVLLADHIIVADGDFVSLADDGILR